MGRIRIEVYDLVFEKRISDKLAYALFKRFSPKPKRSKLSGATPGKREEQGLALIRCGQCGLAYATVEDYKAHLSKCKQA